MFVLGKNLSFLALIIASIALADAGSVGGNGGGGEVEFLSIRTEVTSWIEARYADGSLAEKLGLNAAGISAVDFKNAYKKAANAPVIFQDAPVTLTGSSSSPVGRICANGLSPRQIVCQNANWALATPQIKYAIVLHETLGIAGLEANQGQYSQYPISKNILSYIARASHFELGAKPNHSVELRERFAAAVNPSKEQLEGESFSCLSFPALLPGSGSLPDGRPMNFRLLADQTNSNGLVVSMPGTRMDGTPLSDGYQKEWYGRKSTEMAGMEVYLAFRWEPSTGKILVEFSGTNAELQYGIPYQTPHSEVANFGPGGKVWEYEECEVSGGN